MVCPEVRNIAISKGFAKFRKPGITGQNGIWRRYPGKSRPRQKFTERIIRNNKPPMDLCHICHIRALRAEEYGRLKEFLYEAIFLPDGAQPLPREVTDDPSLRIYWEGFGREPDDRALCAEAKGQIIGAIWCRMLPEGVRACGSADTGAGSGGSCGLQGARDRESIDRADARGAAGCRICAGLAGRAAGQPGTSALSPVRIRSHPGDSRRVHHGQIAAVESTTPRKHAQQPEALRTGRGE